MAPEKPIRILIADDHTIVRQGFDTYQVQGVRFHQLGQGGRLGHYPVHFHMARETPTDTFVKDTTVWDSMTRFMTIHATHGVLLARNVGFMSIGHGYYLEDGTEINNRLFSNLGILARAAVSTPQNPRQVPGILAWSGNPTAPLVPYNSDIFNPTIFWIMNGWNDFEYNMAAGATGCGLTALFNACHGPVTLAACSRALVFDQMSQRLLIDRVSDSDSLGVKRSILLETRLAVSFWKS